MTIRVAIVLAAWWLGIHGDDRTEDGDGNDADDMVGTACMQQPEEHCTLPAGIPQVLRRTASIQVWQIYTSACRLRTINCMRPRARFRHPRRPQRPQSGSSCSPDQLSLACSVGTPARRSRPSSEILSPRRRETLLHNASVELGRSVSEAPAWSIGTDDRHSLLS